MWSVAVCSTAPRPRSAPTSEVLADFRPSAKTYRIAEGESIMAQGAMPRSWRERRALAEFSLHDPLPFVDVESDATLTHLTKAMAEELDELGVTRLDVSVVRGPNRLLTRAIAKWVYTRVDEEGRPLYGGVRYLSRFQSHECWAVFNGAVVGTVRTSPITLFDSELTTVARDFGITLHWWRRRVSGPVYCASSAATSRNASLRRLVRAARSSGSRTNSAWGEGWNVLTTVRLRSCSMPGARRSSRRHA